MPTPGQKTHSVASLTSKGPVAACDDNSPDVAVGFKSIQGLSHLSHQPVTQSVESFGSVQLDEAYVVLLTSLLHQDILILTTCMKSKQTLTFQTFVNQTNTATVLTGFINMSQFFMS